ncbi:TetR/AcrR family transcriptional regulator C-terminal domain-containing protein, partial [Glaesserella parasuis]|uniref:TetR/AcrR family transcriptional regulator C-terminal domain-containing protein n=1 Tax=Glaesserella parasuis TaxID=738 RepID=UPI003F40B821
DGLSTRDAVYVFRMLNNFCGGTALDELTGQRTAAWPPLDGMAHLVSAAPLLAPERFDEVFEYGLDVILEGLARRVKPT